MKLVPQRGDFVRVRSRRWLVEDGPPVEGLSALRLACIDDDAQGEFVSVLWDAELDAEVLADEGWASVSKTRDRRPERLFGLSAHAALEHRDRGRSRPFSGAVPGRHPPGRLSASPAAKGAAPSAREPADRRRRRRRQDGRGGPDPARNAAAAADRFRSRRRARRHGPPVAGRTRSEVRPRPSRSSTATISPSCDASAATAPIRGLQGRALSSRIR